ncbi:MAG: hypothetical protein J4G14_13680 [Dehalococcoidia bacterium]|nr:hypothetical protein [Dehalococcoidia bacterium]
MIIDNEQCARCGRFVDTTDLSDAVRQREAERSIPAVVIERVCPDCYTVQDRRNAVMLPDHPHAGGRCECHQIAMRQMRTGL